MKKQKKEVTIRDFILLACHDANITIDELREGKHARIIELKRDIVWKLYCDERISLSTIAAELGYYDRSGAAKLIAGVKPAEYRKRAIRRGWDNLDIITAVVSEPTPPNTQPSKRHRKSLFFWAIVLPGLSLLAIILICLFPLGFVFIRLYDFFVIQVEKIEEGESDC